jgi:PPOX class probable F420-dependent enzyme
MIGQAMNDNYSKWSDVRAKGRAVDPRPPAEQAAGKALARGQHVRLTAATADVLPDTATSFGQRVRTRLRDDELIWIVTVGADGRPQPNPVGFCRDGDADSTEFVIYSRSDAHRLIHLRERPDQVSFHLDSDRHGQDVIVLQGQVVVDHDHPAIKDWPPYLEKYGAAVERAFGSIATFSESYPIALRVTITSVRGFFTGTSRPHQGR